MLLSLPHKVSKSTLPSQQMFTGMLFTVVDTLPAPPQHTSLTWGRDVHRRTVRAILQSLFAPHSLRHHTPLLIHWLKKSGAFKGILSVAAQSPLVPQGEPHAHSRVSMLTPCWRQVQLWIFVGPCPTNGSAMNVKSQMRGCPRGLLLSVEPTVLD